MKRSIYQKLLLSLLFAAFFIVLASAQVMNRSQVSPEMIEMKKKAKAEGLKAIPAEWMQEAEQTRLKRIRNKRVAAATTDGNKQTESNRNAKQLTTVSKRKTLEKENLQKRNSTDIRGMRMTRIKLPNGKVIVTDANNKEMVRKIMEANSN